MSSIYEPSPERAQQAIHEAEDIARGEQAAGIAAFAVFVYGLVLALVFQGAGMIFVGLALATAVVAYMQYVIAPARDEAWARVRELVEATP